MVVQGVLYALFMRIDRDTGPNEGNKARKQKRKKEQKE